MKTLLRGLAASGVLILILVAAIVLRAATWKPPASEGQPGLPPPAKVDVAAAARHLGEAIRFRTVSHQDAGENDWSQWDALQAWLAATYPQAHAAMTRETAPGTRALVWTWRGADPALPPVVFMAHQDVVPVEPETLGRWRHAPFAGEVAEGAVWGRGSADDKGSLIGLMEAIDALAARGFHPKRTVIVISGHDEEAGGTGAAAAAALLASRAVKPLFVLDEGDFALTSNPVSGRPVAAIGIAEKGYATLVLTAHGAGGHSSAPPDQTAVHTLARAVDRIASDRFSLRFDGPGADMIRVIAADAPGLKRALIANDWLFGPLIARQMGALPAGAAMLRTTIAPTVLQGSPKENVLPDRAVALINYRLHPRDTLDQVMARARRDTKGLKVDLAWEQTAINASPTASTRTEAWRVIAALARSETGARAAPTLFTGATDARRLTGLTSEVYRFQPILLRPDDIEMFHGVNEHMPLQGLKSMISYYERLIEAEAGQGRAHHKPTADSP